MVSCDSYSYLKLKVSASIWESYIYNVFQAILFCILFFSRILRNITSKLGLKLNKFIEEDINTYYYINGQLHKTYKVKANPDVLNYPVRDDEKGKSAFQLFNESLWKVSTREQIFYAFNILLAWLKIIYIVFLDKRVCDLN